MVMEQQELRKGVAVKPLEEEAVPLTGATINVRNLEGDLGSMKIPMGCVAAGVLHR